MDNELKPCPYPWCKSKTAPSILGRPGLAIVMCGCGTNGPEAPNKEEAIAAWNRRPEQRVRLEGAVAFIEGEYLEGRGAPSPAWAKCMKHLLIKARVKLLAITDPPSVENIPSPQEPCCQPCPTGRCSASAPCVCDPEKP
jgi:hypothetical protein